MKKSVILAVLGLAVGAVSSFGQGSIIFNSYNADGGSGTTVTTFGANGSGFTGLVGSGTSAGLFDADILYSTSSINDTAGTGALSPGWLTSGSGSPSANNLVTLYGTGGNAGYFVPVNNFTLNPYTAGSTVSFEVITYLASAGNYASSAIRGHSASFTATLATGQVLPVNALWSSFTVGGTVPEPTTLALAGLGGLASLVMLRRKKA